MSLIKQLIIQELDQDTLATLLRSIVQEELKKLTATNTEEKLFKRSSAAEFLQITPPTLDTLTLSGEVKGYRLGHSKLYKKSELLASLKQIKVK